MNIKEGDIFCPLTYSREKQDVQTCIREYCGWYCGNISDCAVQVLGNITLILFHNLVETGVIKSVAEMLAAAQRKHDEEQDDDDDDRTIKIKIKKPRAD